MVLQTLCAALYHNSARVLSAFEQCQSTELFVTDLVKFLPEFNFDYEMRRVIYGVTRLIATDNLPIAVQSRLPEIFKGFSALVLKQFK